MYYVLTDVNDVVIAVSKYLKEKGNHYYIDELTTIQKNMVSHVYENVEVTENVIRKCCYTSELGFYTNPLYENEVSELTTKEDLENAKLDILECLVEVAESMI